MENKQTFKVEGDRHQPYHQVSAYRWRVTEVNQPLIRRTSVEGDTLRVEGDDVDVVCSNDYGISIHTLRMEGDVRLPSGVARATIFQSTPSAWRVTP